MAKARVGSMRAASMMRAAMKAAARRMGAYGVSGLTDRAFMV